jgi:hypothetical protein
VLLTNSPHQVIPGFAAPTRIPNKFGALIDDFFSSEVTELSLDKVRAAFVEMLGIDCGP